MILLGFLLPAISWALFILLLYGLPSKDLPVLDWIDVFSFDKLLHATFFALLSVFLITALKRQQEHWYLRKHAVVIAVSVSGIYGTILEVVQGIAFDGRDSDFFDWIANSVGAIAGWIAFKLIYGRLAA